MPLSEAPCLEMRKTAKPAIHERSVYNLLWPLTAKQCAAEHYGPLQGEERVITSSNSCLSVLTSLEEKEHSELKDIIFIAHTHTSCTRSVLVLF